MSAAVTLMHECVVDLLGIDVYRGPEHEQSVFYLRLNKAATKLPIPHVATTGRQSLVCIRKSWDVPVCHGEPCVRTSHEAEYRNFPLAGAHGTRL
jgi:hypothetical protein